MNAAHIANNVIFQSAYDDDAKAITNAVNQGVDVNEAHPLSGHTPLQAACETNALNAIQRLISLGADPNKRFTKISRVDGHIICNNSVPLMEVSSIESATLLLRAGADIQLEDDDGLTVVDWARKRKMEDLAEFMSSIRKNLMMR